MITSVGDTIVTSAMSGSPTENRAIGTGFTMQGGRPLRHGDHPLRLRHHLLTLGPPGGTRHQGDERSDDREPGTDLRHAQDARGANVSHKAPTGLK